MKVPLEMGFSTLWHVVQAESPLRLFYKLTRIRHQGKIDELWEAFKCDKRFCLGSFWRVCALYSEHYNMCMIHYRAFGVQCTVFSAPKRFYLAVLFNKKCWVPAKTASVRKTVHFVPLFHIYRFWNTSWILIQHQFLSYQYQVSRFEAHWSGSF